MRTINEIIVHCSATPDGKDFTVEQIRQWHLNRGFSDIGYHYVVYRDGTVHAGRPIAEIGAHCKGHNAHSIGVCYVGGMTADNKSPNDTRTPAQKSALAKLIGDLCLKFKGASVHGHREFANKACPCFDARAEYKHLQR
jgi:N-acetylmuramoyl-L-alanine amidase